LQRWRNFGDNPATLVMVLTPHTKLSN
jgi:hypothetical protein